MGSDLILTGKYGVLNQQRLLNSTSNNINNVNTEGFIRKETQTYTSCVDWGVGATYTRRIYDQYVQRQMYVDSGNYKYYEAYAEGLNTADSILSDANTSLANSMTAFFDELSTAAALPTSSANRQSALQKLEDVIYRYKSANESIRESLDDINGKIHDNVTEINSLSEGIANINYQIRSLNIGDNQIQNDVYLQMLDERDRLINELSGLISIQVVEQSDESYEVYMDSGMLLANGDSFAKLTDNIDEYDVTRRTISLSYSSVGSSHIDKSNVDLSIDNIGGALGGYLNSSKELRYTLRELGKMMVAFADGLNVQNQAGFTLEDVAGAKLIELDSVSGVCKNNTYSLKADFIEGKGANVQAFQYEICYGSDNAWHIYTMDADEKKTEITTSTMFDGSSNTLTLDDYGITLTFGDTFDNMASSYPRFRVQPTFDTCLTTKVAINKPEDFAFASAVRTRTESNNYGNAVISLESCTNTGSAYGVEVSSTTSKPEFHDDAPNKIVFDGTNYVIYSNDGTELGYTSGSGNGVNIFANAVDSSGTTLFADGYPGYEVSIEGTVRKGDTFYVEINEKGQADNSNANALIGLRSSEKVRTTGSSDITTYNEGYANLLAHLGADASSASTNCEAAKTKYDQTVALYESDSGVNLDEEATNLVMFQQSYQACAKIIEASQTIFNALIQSF